MILRMTVMFVLMLLLRRFPIRRVRLRVRSIDPLVAECNDRTRFFLLSCFEVCDEGVPLQWRCFLG